MLHFLEQKNILIVPLSLFIRFNKKIAGEKFANLFGKFFDELLDYDEEAKKHEKFCEDLLKKILASKVVADFNLGKSTQREFIEELTSFLNLSHPTPATVEAAWNSLIEFDRESSHAFDLLIKLTQQGKSIYFIADINELHAKKVLELFADYPFSHLTLRFLGNLPAPAEALPLAVSHAPHLELTSQSSPSPGTVYFCFSYAYKSLLEFEQGLLTKLFTAFKSPSGLLVHLKMHLNDLGKTKDDIVFINPYEKDQAITKKLALDTLSKEAFYTGLLALPAGTADLPRVDSKTRPISTNVPIDDNVIEPQASSSRTRYSSSPY